MRNNLADRIRQKEARIAVVGLGRVGLLTAALLADAGYRVIGVDVKKEAIKVVSSAKRYIREPQLNDLLKRVAETGKLEVTTNTVKAIREADIVILCVQTPLGENKKPNLTYLQKACKAVARGLSKGKLVVVESTVPPGTINNVVANILERNTRLKCGKDFWLAYCPERIASGNAMQEFASNARIVGGYDPNSEVMAAELFKNVTGGNILVTDYMNAEVAKLAENVFRDVNIAFANELSLLCERVGVDVMEVIRLANTHPRVNIHKPGCGVGGPCLTKDLYLLLHPVKKTGFKSTVIEPSQKLNDYMPEHTVELVKDALMRTGKRVANSKVAVLGVAYKGETDDATNSPAKAIIRKLMNLKALVVVYDPYCNESFGAEKAENVEEAVKGADCLVVTTDHKVFEKLDLEKIKRLMAQNPAIIDGRRVINPTNARKAGFEYVGIGYAPDRNI